MAILTGQMPSDSIGLSNRCYEKRNPELPSFGGVQTKAYRGGKEGAPIADELLGNDIDETLGTTAIRDQKEVKKDNERAWVDARNSAERH